MNIKKEKNNTLEKFYEKELRAKIRFSVIERYFKKFFSKNSILFKVVF